LAAGLVVFVVFARDGLQWSGNPGWSLQPAERAYLVEVASVSQRGAAARAGMRAGDTIDVREMTFAERVFLLALPAPPAGHPLALTIERGGSRLHVDLVPTIRRMRWDGWVGNGVLLWMAAFGALIAWRRPGMVEARLLSLALSCYVAGDALQYLTVPSPGLDLLFSAINFGGVLGAISLAALVRFATLFGPVSALRRVVDGLAYAGAALLALYGIVSAAALGALWVDPVTLYLSMEAVGIICAALVLVIVSGAYAVAASRGIERQRVAWAVVSIGTLLAATVVQYVLNALVPSEATAEAAQIAVNLLAVAAPVGLTYSVLSRRLLDIGFALNRAAVFSALSLIIVGSFMAVEWALGGWLVSANHVTSAVVGVALALALGFSVRFMHRRVEQVVDRLFFRKRYEQEAALLRFAREAPFITDLRTLLQRTVDEVTQHSESGSVAILTADRDGTFAASASSGAAPPKVGENDPAMVALRARKEPVDLHALTTALQGEYGFPMISRGELVGELVCGLKRNGDPYAPDEIAALATLALSVATALDTLARGAGGVHAEVLELRLEFAALRDDVRRILDELGARGSTPAP
jgi:hypothetical protein